VATVFKLGREKKNRRAVYRIQYFDEHGKRRQVKGFTDRSLSQELAAKLEAEVRMHKHGLTDPDRERVADHRKLPIEHHVAAFRKGIAHNTPKYVSLIIARIEKVVTGCGITCLGDVEREVVIDFLAALRVDKNLGNRSYNHYGDALDAFGRWLVADKRAVFNPFDQLPRLNPQVDVRHKRRALSAEDVAKLVKAAHASKKKVQLYPGPLRAKLYQMAFLTGLRRRELASLTPRNFRLEDEQPIVTVEAAFSKHRRKDTLPLHPELVATLRPWLASLGPDEPLFPKLARKKTYTMVQKDLMAAGIPYETAEGLADFHAAGRHSHITALFKSGASVTEAKELARHTDVRMTMKYTHVGLKDQARALSNLPAPATSVASPPGALPAPQKPSSPPPANPPEKSLNGRGRAALGLQSCSTDRHSGAFPDTNEKNGGQPRNDASPSEEGLLASDDSESHSVAESKKSGGGGNRTRVPRYFRGGFYVRSRIIYASRPLPPNRRGGKQASQERFLASSVPSSDSKRFGFGDEFLGLSD